MNQMLQSLLENNSLVHLAIWGFAPGFEKWVLSNALGQYHTSSLAQNPYSDCNHNLKFRSLSFQIHGNTLCVNYYLQ